MTRRTCLEYILYDTVHSSLAWDTFVNQQVRSTLQEMWLIVGYGVELSCKFTGLNFQTVDPTPSNTKAPSCSVLASFRESEPEEGR